MKQVKLDDKYFKNLKRISYLILEKGGISDQAKEILEIYINDYINKLSPVRYSIKEIADVLGEAYNTVRDTLNNLVELGVLKTPTGLYSKKYEFPNESVEDSIIRPIEEALAKISSMRLVAVEQAKKLEFITFPPPIKEVDRRGFYLECMRLHDTSDEVWIFSNTPGIILITEYEDPGNPIRKEYFDNLKRRLKQGLKVRYLFNWDSTKNIIKYWIKNNLKDNIERSKNHFNTFLNLKDEEGRKIKTLEIRAIRNTALLGMVIGRKTVVVGLKDPRKTIDPEHAIRGQVINDEILFNHFRSVFETEWNRAKEVDETVIDKILAEIGGSL